MVMAKKIYISPEYKIEEALIEQDLMAVSVETTTNPADDSEILDKDSEFLGW